MLSVKSAFESMPSFKNTTFYATVNHDNNNIIMTLSLRNISYAQVEHSSVASALCFVASYCEPPRLQCMYCHLRYQLSSDFQDI